MKIAYLIHHDISKNDGVTKKIRTQKEYWEKYGHVVKVFAVVPSKAKSDLVASQYVSNGYIHSRLRLNNLLLSDIDSFSPDCVYFRYDTWSLTLSKILKRYKVITELNTFDLGEFKLLMYKQKSLKSVLRFFVYKCLRSRIFKQVYAIVGVTKEIISQDSIKKFKKSSIYIPNSIDLNYYQLLKKNQNDSPINLFFMGTPNQPWHGVDIIEEMAKELPQYTFHIVGIDGHSKDNIYWHGYLSQDEYSKILSSTHICIGSLALHRNNMREACPLKVREYLAYGFPIIIGYDETAFLEFDKLPRYVHRINYNNIDYLKLKSFIQEMQDFIVSHNDISQYISSKHLEFNRISFMQEIIEKHL